MKIQGVTRVTLDIRHFMPQAFQQIKTDGLGIRMEII